MAEFNRDKVDMFLGVVRKYMQVRGPMSQKELAERLGVGVSTMSRFLNQKTSDLNAQLIAKIVANLKMPLHEIIDFIDEEFSDKFIKLVKFHRDDLPAVSAPEPEQPPKEEKESEQNEPAGKDNEELDEALQSLGTATRPATAKVSVPGGQKRAIHFEPDQQAAKSFMEKLQAITPRQKAFIADFLNMDNEARDLVVDMGNAFTRYVRVKGMEI
jgi:transcriptional regulator with XRE-family HTH domain